MHVEGSRQPEIGSAAPLRQILIIGGTGDLSRRHLLPALTRLLANRELAEGFTLTLSGLEPMSVEGCREFVAGELAAHAAHLPLDARSSLVERTSYLHADVRDVDALRGVQMTAPALVYLAMPTEAVPASVEALARADIHRAPARLVFDKPFGVDRKSARNLNARLRELTDERNVYRLDHFLYHQTVQDLMRWRVRSDPLSPLALLPRTEVEIVWDETRWSQSTSPFYAGALRDMIQSHLLQLVATITMLPPDSLTHADLARSRLEALQKITATAEADLHPRLTRATYVKEAGGESDPETLAILPLRSQMPGWEQVRFWLRAANGVSESRRHIELRFAPAPTPASVGFVRLEVLARTLAVGLRGFDAAAAEFSLSPDSESASTRLLRAALTGDDTFTLCAEEPEEAWRIVEPVLQAWADSNEPIRTYPIGASVADILGQGTESDDA